MQYFDPDQELTVSSEIGNPFVADKAIIIIRIPSFIAVEFRVFGQPFKFLVILKCSGCKRKGRY